MRISFDHGLLKFDRSTRRLDRTGELDDRAVATQLDDAAGALGENRPKPLLADLAQAPTVPLSSRPINRE